MLIARIIGRCLLTFIKAVFTLVMVTSYITSATVTILTHRNIMAYLSWPHFVMLTQIEMILPCRIAQSGKLPVCCPNCLGGFSKKNGPNNSGVFLVTTELLDPIL